MTFVPLVALVVFGATIVIGSLRAYRDIEAVNALESLVTSASSLTVVALNHESSATFPFVASGSESARAEMMAMRLASDDAIRTFKTGRGCQQPLRPQALEHISDIERRLDGLNFGPRLMTAPFSARNPGHRCSRSRAGLPT
jgi:hypothetical protein